MYVYIVKSTELGNYIGHSLWEEVITEHDIYSTPDRANAEAQRLIDEEGLDAWVEKKEVKAPAAKVNRIVIIL